MLPAFVLFRDVNFFFFRLVFCFGLILSADPVWVLTKSSQGNRRFSKHVALCFCSLVLASMFDIMSTRGAKFELRPIYAQVDGDYQRGSTGVCVCGFSLHLNFKAPPSSFRETTQSRNVKFAAMHLPLLK